jgi:uncharacterized delta-60 repeat protein
MRVPVVVAAAFSILLTLPGLAAASAGSGGLAASSLEEGDLDPTFDTDGIVTTPLSTTGDLAYAVTVQPDGRIVAVGYASNGSNVDFAVVRYRRDGSLDPTFDHDGIVTTPIGTGDDYAKGVAIQSDGKIIVAGYADGPSNRDVALARYKSNGSLDPTFDQDGIVLQALSSYDDVVRGMALMRDGRIVVGGYSYNGSSNDFMAARFKPSGALDSTFDGDGFAMQSITSGSDVGNAVAVQPDGRVLVAGNTPTGQGGDMTVVRFTTKGALDTQFGTGGVFTEDVNDSPDSADSMALLPNGKIVVGGQSEGWLTVIRISSNGTAEPGWEAQIRRDFASSPNDFAGALAVQPDGRIVAAGGLYEGGYALMVARFLPNGEIDTSISNLGWVSRTNGAWVAFGVALQQDGKIVTAGYTDDGSQTDMGLTRLIGDRTAPWGPRMIGVSRYAMAQRPTLYWTASDTGTGVASFDLRRSQAPYSASSLSSPSIWRSATRYTAGAFTAVPGNTYCFSVRGRDFAGNVGVYSVLACTASPLDERAMTIRGTWSKLSSPSYYLGTALRSRSLGATLSINATYRHLAVVVTRCAGCGTLKVFRGSTLLKTIHLGATKTVHGVVIQVASSASSRTGTIALRQASAGHPVFVEGLAVDLQ